MCNNRNITINILPQSGQAWMWIAVGVAVFSMASCAKSIDGPNGVAIAKINAQAEVEKAKIGQNSK